MIKSCWRLFYKCFGAVLVAVVGVVAVVVVAVVFVVAAFLGLFDLGLSKLVQVVLT